MSKKMKLTLKGIKIESFVTNLSESDANKVKGGYTEGGDICDTRLTCNEKCGDTAYWECQFSDFCTWGGTCTFPKCY